MINQKISKLNNFKLCAILLAILPALVVAGFFVSAALTPRTVITSPAMDGLVGYWNMDSHDISGATLYDRSGYNNHGTIFGATSGVSGKLKQALSFDGLDDYVNAGNDASLRPLNAITVEFWTKPHALKSIQFPLAYGDTGWKGWMFMYATDNMHWFIRNGVTNASAVAQLSPSTGAWHHVVGTYDSPTLKLYTNGIFRDSATITGPIDYSGLTAMYIGNARWLAPARFFNGLIDEVRIYNRALSAAEVLQNFNASRRAIIDPSLTDRFKDGLVLHQSFDGPNMDWALITAEARDTSGLNNHGNVIGPVPAIGKVGQALFFDGVDDFVTVPASTSLTEAALGYTVEVWIKPQVDNDFWTGVVGRHGRNYNFWLGASNNAGGGYVHHRFRTTAGSNDGCPDTPTGSIPMNQWSHVILVNNGSTCWTFINGEIKAGPRTFAPATLISNHTILNIGRNLDQTAIPGLAVNTFRGLIDEVRIYNRALTAAEIMEHYRAGRARLQL